MTTEFQQKWNAMSPQQQQDYALADLKKRHTRQCPTHGGHIADCVVRLTAWCPHCLRIWRVRRSEHSWKIQWFYLKELSVKRQL